MPWILVYRGDGETISQLAVRGRAAALAAAISMIENGVEVLSITDQRGRSVSADEIRRVRELRRVPFIQFRLRTRRESSGSSLRPDQSHHRPAAERWSPGRA